MHRQVDVLLLNRRELRQRGGSVSLHRKKEPATGGGCGTEVAAGTNQQQQGPVLHCTAPVLTLTGVSKSRDFFDFRPERNSLDYLRTPGH
ncbi:hypothetical protein EYF80_027300 [Liparis tanakae]|uniref:Uncharacterized protein n=1 Tax=Liparis tanakae TaxID=230148 RepID=A0A4Z2H9C3_9TELE|nr:hypothetical protein EYF80_027300 [Liparis tanakae]